MAPYKPRQRKHRVRAREEQGSKPQAAQEPDSNTLELLPADQKARAQKKHELSRLIDDNGGQVTGKKRKRLEKFIDNKLRKEQNQALVRQLEKTRVDTSLYRSAKNLGRGRDTKREALSRAARERRLGINVEKNEELLFVQAREDDGSGDDGSDDDGGDDDHEEAEKPAGGMKGSDREAEVVAKEAGAFGGGLKRPLELDADGKPMIKKRKRGKGVPVSAYIQRPAPEEVPWEGFSSNDEDENEDEDEDEDGGVPVEEYPNEDKEDESSSGSDTDDEGFDESEDESEGDESDATSPNEDEKVAKKARTSAFKAWADQARNAAVGFTPSARSDDQASSSLPALPRPSNFTPRPVESDPLPQELQPTKIERKAYAVPVNRSPTIQEARAALPVVAEEQKIMEAIHSNDVVVIWGATGSGKTTQVPQFLFESGYGAKGGPTPGMIGVTQPRRVAAVSMAKRVAVELGDQADRVAHQIRFDASVTEKTAIKFMTDGVLLREVAQDFLLTKYSAVVIDEAHERSVNTDILIGLLSRIVDLRADMAKEDAKNRPLKLVIMSATLRIADFTENRKLFRHASPPLIQAEGRQYPVTEHFSRRTNRDYVEEAFQKVSRGHKKLPKGGILVFLTGQNEIMALAKRLREAFPSTEESSTSHARVRVAATEASLETEDIDLGGGQADFEDDDGSDDDEAEIRGLDDDEDKEFDIGEEPDGTITKAHILPLYSQLPTNQQMRVFEDPPAGSRAIILATNVAETSLTIPGIRYVFDCGRAKERTYDEETNVQSFEIGWISKASASQRAGRAGRTGPGHCYRLYSSAVYERDFQEHALPELLRTPIEGIVLQLKAMDLQHIVNFPFPTPPDRAGLAKAEKLLAYLGATALDGKITKLGRQLSLYPLNPRFSRMLVMGQGNNLTAQAIALVAALSIPEVFIQENQLNLPPHMSDDPNRVRTNEDNLADSERAQVMRRYRKAHSILTSAEDRSADCIKLLRALGGFLFAAASSESHGAEEFCDAHFLRYKALQEASQLRSQLSHIIRTHYPGSLPATDKPLNPPTAKEVNSLRLICAAGFIDQVAIRADLAPTPDASLSSITQTPKRAIDVPYTPLFPTKSADSSPFVYLHPSSLLARSASSKSAPMFNLPIFIVYARLQRSASSTIHTDVVPKTRMHPLTPLTRDELALIARGSPLARYSKPDVGSKVVDLPSEGGVERREVTVRMSVVPGAQGEGSAGLGWPLGLRRVVQCKMKGKGWVFEREV
ncbi:P-loop containing nucleoside triphosphate hydrolase protein [Pseudovirgaria hyperparasitica]|uniref:RNA helicase n=1 Tax=Pseudovirgaria hyperparasitica TaxID=470096 RepID=A0A6A6W0F8_9PEZI|nr:P-loop containing nucleoside triphosphate hydrolase protein [Pseudovirgaria hyperparasitica]KAF2755576.1 P-loop containing nucleoside triphosphate hydrolase protein [Pseudovirgaria hyperparasitica]